MACRGRCKIVYGEVADFANDVVIRSARRYQLNVRTWTEVPGTSRDIPVPALDPAVLNRFKRALSRYIDRSGEDCAPGCYCDSFGQVVDSGQETRQSVTCTITQETVRSRASIAIGADSVDETLDKVRNGQRVPEDDNGKPVPVDGDRDEVRQEAVNCCGQIRVDIALVNYFDCEITFDVTLTLSTEEGECRSLPEGGVVV